MNRYWILYIGILVSLSPCVQGSCHSCYSQESNDKCKNDPFGINSYSLHMSVHPHLDAFWIFDFESYYSPKSNQGNVHSYFASNRFHSVKQIFDTTSQVLKQSKKFRQQKGGSSQKAHRSFFNSEMGFFKRWYFEQNQEKKKIVKELLGTKYWEILGGGFVEHDEGCAYYDDIIENYQMGLRFLKEEFQYQPKAAVSADSFGHSSTTLAILAHLGVEGFFVERSDEHILLQNKTQFIWKATSANGKSYGALPTHIRWAIHGFQDQFIQGEDQVENTCKSKKPYFSNLEKQNQFLKRILKSNHIMRYFGHDFQQFDEKSYTVIEGIMEKFSRTKCNSVTAHYGNPTEYFLTLMGEVFNKTKPVATRSEDIFPIWDYDSGLYWSGYYTTDPFHKKNYRDAGRFLHALRKAFLPSYLASPTSKNHVSQYGKLQEFAETVTYLQHHDGISGTSKYQIMDQYEVMAEKQKKQLESTILNEIFEEEFPDQVNNPFTQMKCSLENQCIVPPQADGDIYLKIFNSAGTNYHEPIIVQLHENQFYQPDCEYFEYNCLCTAFPCPCSLYLFSKLSTYTLIKLKKVEKRPKDANLLKQIYKEDSTHIDSNLVKANSTHFTILHKEKQYSIGYKKLSGNSTSRRYDHLSRYGRQATRSFTIRSGKYALGNDVKTEKSLSSIRKVLVLESDYLKKYIIIWKRAQMKTIITTTNQKINQFKIETISAAEIPTLEDLYLEISAPHIQNNRKFYTDSNGWLVMKRQLFKHQDYSAYFSSEGFDDINGNSYPITAFAYITNQNGQQKVSINTDRPQGVIAYKPSTLWLNFDRLTADDGKWVYETTFRSEFQKFTHYLTIQNDDYNERKIQKLYDSPLLIQPNLIQQSLNTENNNKNENKQLRDKWIEQTGLNEIKFFIKPWNDSTVTLRIHNLHDQQYKFVYLFTEDHTCPLLTAFYGNTMQFSHITEMSLGGNMDYQQFLNKKWNWETVVDLKKENQIFNKKLSSIIELRPLEIRTFQLRNVKISEKCDQIQKLKTSAKIQEFKINLDKKMTSREKDENEERIKDYMLNGDHCAQAESPIVEIIKDAAPHKNIDYHTFEIKTYQQYQRPPQSSAQQISASQSSASQTNVKDKQVKREIGENNKNKQVNNNKDGQNQRISQISQKINRLEKLSKKQKDIYFSYRFKQIKSNSRSLKSS